MADMLVLSTVARSLALQSPGAWPLARAHGLDLTFAASEDGWSDALAEHGRFVPLRGTRTLQPAALVRLAQDLRRLATARDWDLVQVQTPIVAGLWRAVAPAHVRRRTVYVAHGFHFQRGDRSLSSQVYRTAEGLLAHRTLGLATVAAEDAAWARNLPRPLRPRHAVALPGAGVEVSRFRLARPVTDVPPPYALFCGDLNPNKDPVLAVAAVDAARENHPDLRLVIIGEGPLRAEVEQAATMRPWLRLVDRTDRMESWMAGAAVLLAPSHREGVPRVVIEALAAGTPVVARANRGSRELLGGGVGTVLASTTSAAAWARAIGDVLTTTPPRQAMARRAESYDVGAFETAYADLLSTLLGSAAPA